MLSFVREHFAIIRVHSGNQVPRARLAASGPIPRGCLVFFMPLHHNQTGEQVNKSRVRI